MLISGIIDLRLALCEVVRVFEIVRKNATMEKRYL
jgi:hypothetical protein